MLATRERKQQTGGLAPSRHSQALRARTAGTRSPDSLRDPTYCLQRYLGNSYMQTVEEDGHTRSDVLTLQRACACGGTCASCAEQEHESEKIQPKLIVGQPNDVYEREADQVAETVMRLPEPPTPQDTARSRELQGLRPQHLPTEGNDEVRRQPLEEEEETLPLQAKERSATGPSVTPGLATRIRALRGGGKPLPDATRAFFEPRFGYDFSPVRVHTDARAAEAARAVHARAFTVGQDVVFGAGQYALGTTEGQRLLAHELAHVVQQNGPQLQRAQTTSAQGMVIEGDAPSERDPGRIGVSGTYGSGIDVSGVHSGGTVRHELGQVGVTRRKGGCALTHTLQQNSGSALNIQRAPAPGSYGNVGGCQVEGVDDLTAGDLADIRLKNDLGRKSLMVYQILMREIPRAYKGPDGEYVGTECPGELDANGGFGAPDLFLYERPFIYMAEIKSINQPGRAAEEYRHYARRVHELVARFRGPEYGEMLCNDEPPAPADLFFDERLLRGDIGRGVDVGPTPVTVAMVPNQAVDAGPFPLSSSTSHLFYENNNDGGVVYWCDALEEGKDQEKKSRKEPESPDASEGLQQEGSTLDYALNCVVEGVLGEIVHDPSMCGILLDSALSLIPYADQAADIRDTLAHLYWILYRGEYDNPSRWIAVAFTLVGYLPEAGSAIKSTSKIGEKAIREGLQKIDDLVGPQLRKNFAAENLDAVLESIIKQQSKWKADGIELFNKGLGELEYRLEQAMSAAALLARMTGFGTEAVVKLIKDEIARVQKLMADAPKMLNKAFDEVFARITRTIEALKHEPVDIHPPTSAVPVKAPATPSTSAPRRPVGAAQQELFERH